MIKVVFIIMLAVQQLYAYDAHKLDWTKIKELPKNKVTGQLHFIEDFALTPKLEGVPAIANCLAQVVKHNRINADDALDELFSVLCIQNGIKDGSHTKKVLIKNIRKSFGRRGEKNLMKAFSGRGKLAGNYKSKYRAGSEASDGMCTDEEYNVFEAFFFLKKGSLLPVFNYDVDDLNKGLDYCSELFFQAYDYDKDKTLNLNKMKGYLLRNRPIVLISKSKCLVAYGYFNDRLLIYNPENYVVLRVKGYDIPIIDMKNSLQYTKRTEESCEMAWYVTRMTMGKSTFFKHPFTIAPITLESVTINQLEADGFKAHYYDNFRLDPDVAEEFKEKFYDVLKKLDN